MWTRIPPADLGLLSGLALCLQAAPGAHSSIRFAVLLAGALAALPIAVRAGDVPDGDLEPINVRYHGGPLLQHVRVATLFWGRYWLQKRVTDYFTSFFRALFTDGRYMANLAQYSTEGFPIGNGTLVATARDGHDLPARVTDEQIQAEIRAQIAAGQLPQLDPNTLYVVFTPPQVVVDTEGRGPEHDVYGYHNYFFDGRGSGFAYAVIPFNPRGLMTIAASHQLADAVTDPQPALQRTREGGWYDEHNGEIGQIPVCLRTAGRISQDDLVDPLVVPDGRPYLVQKVWSVRDGKPVAFARGLDGPGVNTACRQGEDRGAGRLRARQADAARRHSRRAAR
jgi:hypothetical protein